MSRFWAADGSSSDESSSSDGSDESSVASVTRKDNMWTFSDDDSDSEDEVRVVKSAKDRAWEGFRAHVQAIRNATKIGDWSRIQTEFDDLNKKMARSKALIAQHGGVPRFYVRCLCDLEDALGVALTNAKGGGSKKLSAANSRALNRMKLVLRRNNKDYASVMEEYRANPVLSDEEDDKKSDDDDSDEDDDEEESSSEEESASSEASDEDSSKSSDDDDDDSEKSSDDDSEEDSDDDESEKSSDDDNDDDSNVDWGSSSSSSSSDDDSDAGAYAELKGRARWLKKNTVVSKKKVVTNVDKEKQRLAKKQEREQEKKERQDAASRATAGSSRSLIPEAGLTPSLLDKKVREIVASRGRRGVDGRAVVRQLEALCRLARPFGPRVEVPIRMHLVTYQFDLQRTMDDCMDVSAWRSSARHLSTVTSVLDGGKWTMAPPLADDGTNVIVSGAAVGQLPMKNGSSGMAAIDLLGKEQTLINPTTGEPETQEERLERLRLEKEAIMSEEEKHTIRTVGSLVSFLTRLDEEYTKSLQRLPVHSVEYVVRLRDSSTLVELAEKVQAYYDRNGSHAEAADMARLRIEHLYYRHDSLARQVDAASKFHSAHGDFSMLHPASLGTFGGSSNGGTEETTGEEKLSEADKSDVTKIHPGAAGTSPSQLLAEVTSLCDGRDTEALIHSLCTYVYEHGSDRSRTRAMLCHIFHHALHDRFVEARDLLLMSHLQDTIVHMNDVSTMILFNRMMATLGLAAFRLGRIWDAHQCLSDICSGRVRELLAQGMSTGRFSEKTPDEEKAEKRRQVPPHQHVHLDLLEACYLICAMLLEVPNMAASSAMPNNRNNKTISRTFRKNYEIYERQVFTGPPEQTRDHVMSATRSLLAGDWRSCVDTLLDLDVWKLVPGEGAAERIRTMLSHKIRLEGLRTYVLTNSAQYDSLSLKQLCSMFDLEKNTVHSIISKMMINRELHASWDQPTETVVLRNVEPSPLQLLAVQFADKAAGLVEANERLLDAKSGSYGYKDPSSSGGQGGMGQQSSSSSGAPGNSSGGGDWGNNRRDNRYNSRSGGGGYHNNNNNNKGGGGGSSGFSKVGRSGKAVRGGNNRSNRGGGRW